MNKLKKVRETKAKEESIQSRINGMNETIERKEKELRSYDNKITRSKGEIRALSKGLSSLDKKLDNRTEYLNERIRAIHKRRYGSNALLLLSAADYQDLIRKSRYVSLLAHYDSNVIRKYSRDIEEASAKKRDLEANNHKLRSTKKAVKQKKNELLVNKTEKDKLLTLVKTKRLAQEEKIRKLKESSRKLQKVVKGLKGGKIPQSISGQGFRASKGNLPWPLKGNIMIPYGQYKDPTLNATVFKNGIEIRASRKESPAAVAGGRVVYASTYEGYGKLLIIDHGNGYHSLYGNLSELRLNTGELLIAGMDIGKVRTSSALNAPTLYFEIRHQGRPLDPMPWLQKRG